MAWNTSSTISRKNEALYHKLSQSDQQSYLVHKFFTPQNWLDLYIAYTPHSLEFANNALWRLASDITLDHCYQKVTDPMTKEPVYAMFNLLPTISATIFQLPIGKSNNTYTSAHLVYTSLRAVGKFSPMIIYYDKKDIPGALDSYVKNALYSTDAICRWIALSSERLQSDNTTDVYSPHFFVLSVISGLFRTKGAELANTPAKAAQDLVTNILNNVMIQPFGLNVEGTTFSKIQALVSLSPYSGSKQSNMDSIPASNSVIKLFTSIATTLTISYKLITYSAEKAADFAPLFSAPYEYVSAIVSIGISPIVFINSKISEASQTLISCVASSPLIKVSMLLPRIFYKSNDHTPVTLKQASLKGAMFLVGAIALDTVKLIATNFASAMLLAPISRIIGSFAEEVTEYASNVTKNSIDSLVSRVEFLSECLVYLGETGAINDVFLNYKGAFDEPYA